MKRIFLSVFIIFTASSVYAQTERLEGDWEGAISGPRGPLNIKLHFVPKVDSLTGTINIQGVTLPLLQIRTTDSDSVFFEFHTTINVAKFKGVFKNDSIITGQYYQAGYSFPFKLGRGGPEPDSTKKQAALTYNHKDLVIKNDSIKIGGTLTWPKNQATNELVIIISGSGAQNRDGQIPITDFEPYAVLARSLTPKGLATFRYDDRGVAKSTGSLANATLDMVADDVEAVIQYFSSSHDSIPGFSEIILLGHSQGGIVAGKAAAESESVDKLILMASTGISLKEVLRYQVKNAFERANLPEKLINKEITSRENLMQAVLKEQNIDEAQKKYKRIFAKVQRTAGVDSARSLRLAHLQVQALTDMLQEPLMNSLLIYNPITDLKQLEIPVLVLFGGKDTQVPVELNKKPIKKALEMADVPYVVAVFNKANHLFQKAQTGEVSEYGLLESQFVDGFVPTIVTWIKGH